MIRNGIRRLGRRVKRRVKKMIGRDSSGEMVSQPASPFASDPASSAPVSAEPSAPEPPPEPADDVVGPALTREEVEALFEDMVRPALQSDGGDIDLVKVQDNDVYVRLTGACSTCPSSTVTMKMGVERLLNEEFPHFRSLYQVP